MPLYDWRCDDCGHVDSTWASIDNRDAIHPAPHCGKPMRRLPGGRGLLYFEEGRARMDIGLGGKPITSHGDRARRMKKAGLDECGDFIPQQVRDNPQTLGMKRRLEKDSRGRWI